VKSDVEKALSSAHDTRALLIDRNIIDRVPFLFKEQFPGRKAVVICDVNTYKVAGRKVHDELLASGLTINEPFIFTDPGLYAEFGNVTRLEESLKTHNAIPVAVGSGTINDLTKLSSYRTNRPYMCVATAASMDGYTSYGASITYKGSKQTFSCPAPKAVLADIEIIRNAPPEMTASGYADLFAKVTAGADWILADAVGEEPINERAWSIVQDGLKDALNDPQGAREGAVNAITPLTEGLILGGFAMQWAQSSRPASGAEHQFSHLWNMEHHTYNGETPSHGFQVGVATMAITTLYEKMLNTTFEKLDVKACCSKWPEWCEIESSAEKMFGETDFLETAISESKAKYITQNDLSVQLEIFKNNWPGLRDRLTTQLISSDEVRRRFRLVGAPVEPEEIGVSKIRMRHAFIRAQYIRRRFTVLDIALRTGYLEKWLDEMF